MWVFQSHTSDSLLQKTQLHQGLEAIFAVLKTPCRAGSERQQGARACAFLCACFCSIAQKESGALRRENQGFVVAQEGKLQNRSESTTKKRGLLSVSISPKIRFPKDTCFVPTLRLEGNCTDCRYRGEAKCAPVLDSRRAGQTKH